MVPYAYAKKYKKIVMRYHAAFEKNAFHFFDLFDLKMKIGQKSAIFWLIWLNFGMVALCGMGHKVT